MRVMTCNIRYSAAPDGDNRWVNRRELALRVIQDYSPAVIGFQELRADQFNYLRSGLPDMDTYFVSDQPGGYDPVNAIFYQRKRYELLSAGVYWLSDTPHVPGSRSWDSACVRLCNWVTLRERETGREFRLANTHLDHISQLAREKGAEMIQQDVAVYPSAYSQVLTGDMNANSTNPALQSLFLQGWKDSYATMHGVLEPGNTFHQFLGPHYTGSDGKIDWILYRGKIHPTGAQIVMDSQNDHFPSDHYFVCADFELL